MSWKWFSLILASINGVIFVNDYSTHDYYWAMVAVFVGIFSFGQFIHYTMNDLFKIQKPRKEENIYE